MEKRIRSTDIVRFMLGADLSVAIHNIGNHHNLVFNKDGESLSVYISNEGSGLGRPCRITSLLFGAADLIRYVTDISLLESLCSELINDHNDDQAKISTEKLKTLVSEIKL